MSLVATNSLFYDARSAELIIYISERWRNLDGYGATLLNKALYLIDNLSYLNFKKQITKFKYIHQDKGPTPSPSQFLAIREKLIETQQLKEIKVDYWGLVQKRLEPLRSADINVFDKAEIVLIDKVLQRLSSHSASSVSDMTHNFMAWQISENMEELPLYTFMLSSRSPTDSDIAWAENELAKSKKSE